MNATGTPIVPCRFCHAPITGLPRTERSLVDGKLRFLCSDLCHNYYLLSRRIKVLQYVNGDIEIVNLNNSRNEMQIPEVKPTLMPTLVLCVPKTHVHTAEEEKAWLDNMKATAAFHRILGNLTFYMKLGNLKFEVLKEKIHETGEIEKAYRNLKDTSLVVLEINPICPKPKVEEKKA